MARQKWFPSCVVVLALLHILAESKNSTEDGADVEDVACIPIAPFSLENSFYGASLDHIWLSLNTWRSQAFRLEFMPAFRKTYDGPIKGRPREDTDDWDTYANTTWTNQTEIQMANVTPDSRYDVNLYVRALDDALAEQFIDVLGFYSFLSLKDSISISILTEDAPNANWNLTATQLSATKVLLAWMVTPAVDHDTIYRVSMAPSSPEYSKLTGFSYEHIIIDYDFIDGTNYTFTVTLHNALDFCGVKSVETRLLFDLDAVSQVTNLTVEETGETWAYLTWNAVSNVDGYTVRTNTSSNRFIPWYPPVNTTKPSCYITGLSPDTQYYFHVNAYRGHSSGPAEQYFSVTTRGQSLPTIKIVDIRLVTDEVTAVQLVWQPPPQKPDVEWEYAIYYGTTERELFERGARHFTKDTALTVRHLDACELYFFRVIVSGPFGFGNGHYTDLFTVVTTGTDFDAPPKKVAVWYSAGSATDAEIVWSPPCHPQNTSLGYLVTIQDLTLNSTLNFSLSSNDSRLHLRQSFHYGADYEIFIQVDSPESRAFGPLAVAGPPIPPPHQLALERHNNGDVVLHWKDQDLPAQVVSHNYSYYVWISRNQSFEDNDTVIFETIDKELLLTREWQLETLSFLRSEGNDSVDENPEMESEEDQVFYLAVSIYESHGYESARSQPLSVIFSTLNSFTWIYVAIAAAACVLLILVIIVLVVLCRRRRRLASPDRRYHTRSGSATIRLQASY